MASSVSTKMDHPMDSRVFQEKIKVPLSPLTTGQPAFKGRHSYFHTKKKEPMIAKPVIPFDLSVCYKRANVTTCMPGLKQDLGSTITKDCKNQGGGPKIRKPLSPSLHLRIPLKAFSTPKESPAALVVESKSPVLPSKKDILALKSPTLSSSICKSPISTRKDEPVPSNINSKQNSFSTFSNLVAKTTITANKSSRNKSTLKRPTSMLVLPTQGFGNSVSRSRPPSPSGRRTPSPGSALDPALVETVRQRIRKVQRARLYLLQQPGPHSFLVAADSPEHKYKVIVGPQNCTCGKSPHCIHILFVMLRVFQVRTTDPKLFARTLKNFEVEELIKRYQIRRKKQVNSNPAIDTHCKKNKLLGNKFNRTTLKTSSSESSLSNPSTIAFSQEKRSENEGPAEEESALCPICLLDMVEGESLVTCEQGCRNKLHHHCIAIWAEECFRQNEKILCPLCRAEWPSPAIASNRIYHKRDIGENVDRLPNVPVVSNRSPNSTNLTTINHKTLKSHNLYSSSQSHLSSLSSSSSSSSSSPLSSSSITPTSSIKSSSIASSNDTHQTRPISHLKLPYAQAWLQVFGNEFVSSLASTNWSLREKALKWLARQVKSVLVLTEELHDPGGGGEGGNNLNQASSTRRLQDLDTVCETCCNIIQSMITDPVYKVYIAALRVLRIVLAHSLATSGSDLKKLQQRVRPILKAILLKCADGSRRSSQLSIATLIEMARGQAGALAVGTQTKQPATEGLGGVEFIVNCTLEDDMDNPKVMKHWQWLLGRLVLVERLIEEFPHEFYLLYVQLYPSTSTGNRVRNEDGNRQKLLNYQRLTTLIGFAKKALEHPHTTVNKMAHRVFLMASRLTAHVPAVFSQIFDMISDLDTNVQNALLRKLDRILEDLNTPVELNDKKGKRKVSGNSNTSNSTLDSLSSRPSSRRNSLIGRNQERNLIQEKLVSDDEDNMFSRNSTQRWSGRSLSFSFENHSNTNSAKEFQNQKTTRPSYLPLRSTNCPSNGLSRNGRDSFRNKKSQKSESEFSWKCEEELSPSVINADTGFFNPSELDLPLCNLSKEPTVVNDLIDLSPSITLTPSCDSGAFSPISFRSEVGTPVTPDEPLNWNKRVTSLVVSPKTPDIQLDTFPIIPGLRNSPDEELIISMQPDITDNNYGELVLKQDQQVMGSYIENVHWNRGPLLGTGAFSSCYQARDDRTGILMAVKQVSFFRNDELEQEKVMEEIREEIIMMSKLRHPNVLRILGATEQGGHYNVFVEWMAGGSVASLLDRYGPFKEQITLKYTWQVLDGLAYLHDNQILHRDLKGANLLVDSTGHHLRIADFGAAVRMRSQATVAGEFQGQLLGTIAFMAPEVLRGENYGRSCDVWSVGCVLIEMATAKPPWNANDVSNHLALIFKIACSNTPPPIPDDLSSATQDLALQCLQVNSLNRSSAKNLLNHPCFHQCLM